MKKEALRRLNKYYITSAGRIWGVKPETEDTEAQTRRNVMGNNFDSLEKAALAKARIEAWARVRKYALRKMRYEDGKPVLEFYFDFPKNESSYLEGDLRILIDDDMAIDYEDPLESPDDQASESFDDSFEHVDISYSDIPESIDEDDEDLPF